MLKRVHPSMIAALCGLALSLLTVPGAPAETPAKVLLTARATAVNGYSAFLDTGELPRLLKVDVEAISKLYTGSEWSFQDDGLLVVRKGDEILLATVWWPNTDRTWILLHHQIGNMSVNGQIDRLADPKQGEAAVFRTVSLDGGRGFHTSYLSVSLSFATQ